MKRVGVGQVTGGKSQSLKARLGVTVALAVMASACVAIEPERRQPTTSLAIDGQPAGPYVPEQDGSAMRGDRRGAPMAAAAAEAASIVQLGSGNFISEMRPGAAGGKGGLMVRLVDVEAEEAIQQILGETLRLNYVIEDVVQGAITIQTSSPVDRRTLLRLLGSALESRGAVLLNENGFYRVALAAKAGTTTRAIGYGANAGDLRVGPGVQIVPLNHISALEMEKILKPLASEGAIARVDTARNLLILKDDARNLDSMLDMIDMFDIDYMAGMSFAMVPVRNTSAKDLVGELEQVFGANGGSPMAGLVRFVPIERLNAVLAISARPDHLEQVQTWMQRLDRSGQLSDQSFYVVPLQNRPAKEVAELLQSTLTQQSATTKTSTAYGVQPGMTAVVSETSSQVEGGTVTVPGQAAALAASEVRVHADDGNNSLVILATPEQYKALEQVIDMLDVTPNQVLLEATIAEVTLKDDLAYGFTWFLQENEFNIAFSDAANGAVAQSFPGFSVLANGSDGRAALSAVASVTDVKVLSSPSLMVLDNRTATLQVGDQVPIVTQTAVSTVDPDAPIVNQVSLRDTGVILKVTPRVNEGGRVMLDIEQEVSDVVETQTSGIDSPTIQQRRIQTTVSVDNGSTIALGGLIRDRVTDVGTKIPLLGDIPGLGSLFRTTSQRSERTELVVLITPRVVAGPQDSQRITEELRDSMRSVNAAIEDAARRAAGE